MIDLPLRHRPSGPPVERVEPGRRPSPPSPPRPPSRPRGEGRRRRRVSILWLLPLLLLLILVWWVYWPAPARIVASEATLAFATTRVGLPGDEREVRISNEGERALKLADLTLTGDAAADFVISDEDCVGRPMSPRSSCTIRLRYEPKAAGEREGILEVHGNAANSPLLVPMSASAIAPAVGLAPEAIEFGAAQVRGERPIRQLTISNVGSAPLKLDTIEIEGPHASEFDRDRRCPQSTLAPGEACAFGVRFSPDAAGTRRADLTISSDAPESLTRVPLSGQGVWEGPPLEAEPKRVDLGEQRVGRQSAERKVRFANRTASAVSVDTVAVLPTGASFVVLGDRCAARSLGSGERCEIRIAVAPAAEGLINATLELGFAAAGTLRVPLVARGVAPRLSAATTALDFGELRTGFESAARSAAFSNTGSATLELRDVRLRGAGAEDFVLKSDCRQATIVPGKTCAIGVSFRPRATGTSQALLEVSPSDDLPPLTVALRGVGTAAGLSIVPDELEWSSLQLGKAEGRRLVISNSGSARLEVNGLRVSGSAAGDFSVDRIGCRLDAGLGPGERCELSIRFAPSATGIRSATLEIDHNGADSPFRVGLAGGGEPPRPVFRASARDFGFGSVGVGTKSGIATLTISNPGGSWLPLGGIKVRGQDASEFELVAGTCDGVTALAPGGSCTIGVRFVPQRPGRLQAVLEVRHGAPGNPDLITLAGIGG
ncbi:MAG: choice-of-anchor D domain-containing protein [Acidobacteriota bacterium]|nr:choice-of-anchor D domain-containing protein [Acidobacteriota bacterium]